MAPAVGVSRVDKIHAEVEKAVDRAERFAIVCGAKDFAPDRHRAKADIGDAQSRPAERPIRHRSNPPCPLSHPTEYAESEELFSGAEFLARLQNQIAFALMARARDWLVKIDASE